MNCSDVSDLSSSYLAGTLDAQRSAEFTAHLDSCASCAGVVNLDWRLRDAVLAEHVPTAGIEARVRRHLHTPRSVPRWAAAAGLAAALAMGVFGYRMVNAANPVYAAATEDHLREVVEREHRSWTVDPAAIAALAQREGIAPPRVDLLAPPGYRFEHAKLCRLNGSLVMHLVYSNGAQQVSIFLRPSARTLAVHTASRDGDAIAECATPRAWALVVTGQSRAEAARIARQVASAL